jgi:hypothetical protein
MNVNKQVIASTLVIMAVGVVHAWTAKPPQGITPVVLGGYGLMVILSIVDMFGGGLSQVVSAIAMLALVATLLLEGLPIIQNLGIGGSSEPSGTTGETSNSTGSASGQQQNQGKPGVSPS